MRMNLTHQCLKCLHCWIQRILLVQFSIILIMVHTSVTDAWSLQSTVIISSSGTSSSTRNSMSPTQVSPRHSCCYFRSYSVDFRRGTRTGTGTGTTGTGFSSSSSSSSSSSLVGLFGTKRPSVSSSSFSSSFSSSSSSSSSWDENVIGINSSLDEDCRDDSNGKDEECNVKQVTNVDDDDDDDDVIAVDAAEQQEEGTEQQILSSQETTRSGNNSLQQTIRGGPSMIFAMARRMLVWDDEDYQAGRVLNDASNKPRSKVKVLPRWHPHDGIADANPYFRTQSPVMNNKGYAVTIQRNSRKKNKPGLWRHAYRTYVKVRDMELLQQQQRGEEKDDVEGEGLLVEKKSSTTSLMVESCNVTATNNNSNLTMTVGSQTMDVVRPRHRYPYLPSKVKIRRENRHFQGALVACAKLGLWREAMFILNEMEGMQGKDVATIPNKKKSITINEYVILLVIKACIRGMKNQLNNKDRDAKQKAEEGCRESLDSARDILFSIKKKYSISPSPMIVNPLSSAYQYIGLYSDAEKVLDLLPVPTMNQKEQHQQQQERKLQVNTAATFLMKGIKKDMTETRSTQNDDNAAATSKPTSLLAISSHCKDDASYNILIKNSVLQGNWASAIHSLREMTNAGYYPKSKSLNSWSEAAMKRERRPKKPQWIKQRERILMRNTLSD